MHRQVITWYDFLNNSQRNSLSKHYSLREGLVIRRETRQGNKYAWFRNHVDFWVKTKSLPQNFHEVISGSRKPYFDIDKAESLEKLERAIEEVCLVLLRLLPIRKENLLLFTSIGDCKNHLLHDSSSQQKFSAHIIVHGYYYSSARQVRELYNLVYKELPVEIGDLLDPGVYSSVQNFRLLGSSKLGQNRPKVHQKLILEGEEVKLPLPHPDAYVMEILRLSLVGNVSNSHLLPDIYKETEEEEKEDFNGEEVKEILRFCRAKIEEFPFRKRQIKENYIILQRIKPSFCPSCQRVHENESPYIKVNGIDVYFYCRRGKPLYLGQLGEDKEEKLPFEGVKELPRAGDL